jgi:hypothetical protein
MVRSTRSTYTRQKLETGVDSTTVTLSDAATIISGVIPTSLARRGRQTRFYFPVLKLRRFLHTKLSTLPNISTLTTFIPMADTLHID